MKVLKIDMKRFYAGFKVGEIIDPDMSYIREEEKYFKKKYVNNDYSDHSNYDYSEYNGVTEFQRLQFLLSGLEINAKIQESRANPYVRDYLYSYSKSFLVDMERFRKGERIEDGILFHLYFLYKEDRGLFEKDPLISKLTSEINIDFISFFITVINSLFIDSIEINKPGNYTSNSILSKIKKLFDFKSFKYNEVHNARMEDLIPPFIGIMDRISSNKYRKEKLSFRQKYVIISKLIYLCFKKNKINNKDLLKSGLHYIIWGLIDKMDAECDYLQEIGKDDDYAAFLNSKLFRSPMSARAIQDMYCNVEYIYQKRDILEKKAAWEVQRQILDKPSNAPEKTKRKEWKKQAFINTLKKYKNQSEMARAYGISRQRISELKKKFKIKEL